MTMKAQSASGAVLSLASTPLSIRLSNAIVSYVKYLAGRFGRCAWRPCTLTPGILCGRGRSTAGCYSCWPPPCWSPKLNRAATCWLAGCGFLGTMVPMIGLVQVGRQEMAYRYAYLPLLGIFIMVCWGLSEFAEDKHLPNILLPAISCIVIVGLGLVAHRQIGYWADNITLWTHTIEITAPNYVAQDDLGGALMSQHRHEEAIVHFREAAAIHPVDPISTFNIGFYEQWHGELEEAIEHYKKAIILTTSPSLKIQAWNNMGFAYRDLGNSEQARECFEAAKKLSAP